MGERANRTKNAIIGALVLAASAAGTGQASANSNFEAFGDYAQIVLPAAALACAFRQGRGGDYAEDFAINTLIVQGSKHALGEAEINRRPNGRYKGFPSGHTAAAVSGAADLSRHCFQDNELAPWLLYGTAAIAGYSRIKTDHHNFGQVAVGALVGFTTGAVTFSAGPGFLGLQVGFEF